MSSATLETELDDGYVSARVTWWNLEFDDEPWNGEFWIMTCLRFVADRYFHSTQDSLVNKARTPTMELPQHGQRESEAASMV